jgi:hypothetical protein
MDGKHDEQGSAGIGLPQRIIPRCCLSAWVPCHDHQRAVEKNLLRLSPGYVMFDPILFRVAFIPLESSGLRHR